MEHIRQALREKKLVIIVGAGVTLSAIHTSRLDITWKGLIHKGLDYLQENGFVPADDVDLNFFREVLRRDNAKLDIVLLACSYLKAQLDEKKKFPTWLKSVFGSLHKDVTHPEVLKVLHQFHQRGSKLMTTNYDELLEHYCKLPRVRYSVPGDVRKYQHGSLDGVFHIHGSFQDPE